MKRERESRSSVVVYNIEEIIDEVVERLRLLEVANAGLRTDLRQVTEADEERYRYDRDTARREAEEAARQAESSARLRSMQLVLASVACNFQLQRC